jgi:hypothetical protein
MLTITEALAELKTIDKRLEKKREFVNGFLYRQERFKDPLEKDGGSAVAIKKEMQSISDMEMRKVGIRRAIAFANDSTQVTVCGETRTISEWLTWRRDVVPTQQKFYAGIRAKLDAIRREAMQKGINVTAGETKTADDIVVNIDEKGVISHQEKLEEVLGTLDGQLSLKNATVAVTV